MSAGGVPVIASTDNQFSLLGRALSDLSGAQVGEVCNVSANLPNTTLGFSPTNVCKANPNNLQGTVQALERDRPRAYAGGAEFDGGFGGSGRNFSPAANSRCRFLARP